MLARFRRLLLLGDSAVGLLSSSGSRRPSRLPEFVRVLRPNLPFEVPFARSALLGGDGDRELEIQDRFAKSANDSTVLDRSSGGGASSEESVETVPALSRDKRFVRWSVTVRTLGLDFELGSQDRGRSIIERVRPGRLSWSSRAAAGVITGTLAGFGASAGAGGDAVSDFGVSRAWRREADRLGGIWGRALLPDLRASSNSAMSKEGTSKAGRLGRLLKLFARCIDEVAVTAECGGLPGTVDSRSGVECER